MSNYQLTATTMVIRTSDGAFIPSDPANRDWLAYQKWLAAGGVPDPYVAPPAPIPQSITRRQFYQQLAVSGVIQESDAIAVLSTGTMPPALATVIGKLPQAEQFPAQMFLLGGDTFARADALTIAIGTAYGWTSAQMDAFFTAAAAL